jgi:predicted transglutaminase-like protease
LLNSWLKSWGRYNPCRKQIEKIYNAYNNLNVEGQNKKEEEVNQQERLKKHSELEQDY